MSKTVYAAEKPDDCRFCYFWKNRKQGCRLGKGNCYYLISVPPKPKTECDGCPYGRDHPCIGWCTRKSRTAAAATTPRAIPAFFGCPAGWEIFPFSLWLPSDQGVPPGFCSPGQPSWGQRWQSASPEIPRPAWYRPEEVSPQRIFGVLLDTSGSMDRHLLAAALGSIASYSLARDVNHVRVVFCDAMAYDQGIMSPDEIARVVKARGRVGTRLQPGIDLLNRDPSFPKDAPLLVITDGECDRLSFAGRSHAFLIPSGCSLPFHAKGPVFRLK